MDRACSPDARVSPGGAGHPGVHVAGGSGASSQPWTRTMRKGVMAGRLRRHPAGWAAVRPPPDRFGTGGREEMLWKLRARDLERLKQERERIPRRPPEKHSKRAELNRQNSGCRGSCRPAGQRSCRNFERCVTNFNALAACPVCGHSRCGVRSTREHDCFAGRCRSTGCEARWELHQDPETVRVELAGTDRAAESRIPVFRPGDANSDEWPDDAAPQWVDDVLGCDVLAIPVARDDGSIGFLPPRTASRSP